MHSSLYVGQVRHRRFTPREHQFRYRLFMLYLDLDELPTLFQKFWLWSLERGNIATFKRKDHLGSPDKDLKTSVYDLVEQHTGQRPNGPIRLLTNLAYFGFRFNPVSFYYCFDQQDENLKYIVAEVNNTPWGEQYCYVMNAEDHSGSKRVQQYSAQKQFHVSPFMSLDMNYNWQLSIPSRRLSIHMENYQKQEKVFDATLQLKREAIGHTQLAKILITHPLMTLKIVAAIYFEALRLWLKRIPFIDHPGETTKHVNPSADSH